LKLNIRFFSILLITTLFALLAGCSGQKTELSATDIQQTFERGMTYFEKKNWLKAEEVFTFIIYNDPAGEWADDAQFYLAESHFKRDEFLLAINEYDRLLSRMPNSELVEEATWRKAEAYVELSPDYRLEPAMTEKALRVLFEFLDYYPESVHREPAEVHIRELRDKLARKYFESAELYSVMGEYESAVVYYESVLEEYPDTQYALLSDLGRAEALFQIGRDSEADTALRIVEANLEALPDKEQQAAQTLREKLEEVGIPSQ